MKWITRHYRLLGVITLFVALNALFWFLGPRQIVNTIGVQNTYLVAFLIAAIGGMSSFTGPTYVATIATFAAGGANPWLIGIAGGVGIFISDTVFYFLAWYGRESVPKEWDRWLDRITSRIQTFPTWVVLLFTYLYQGFSPLPGDLLMLALVISGYRYRVVAPVLLVAGITISTLIAHFGGLWF